MTIILCIAWFSTAVWLYRRQLSHFKRQIERYQKLTLEVERLQQVIHTIHKVEGLGFKLDAEDVLPIFPNLPALAYDRTVGQEVSDEIRKQRGKLLRW